MAQEARYRSTGHGNRQRAYELLSPVASGLLPRHVTCLVNTKDLKGFSIMYMTEERRRHKARWRTYYLTYQQLLLGLCDLPSSPLLFSSPLLGY